MGNRQHAVFQAGFECQEPRGKFGTALGPFKLGHARTEGCGEVFTNSESKQVSIKNLIAPGHERVRLNEAGLKARRAGHGARW
jgi:hypothetical protein